MRLLASPQFIRFCLVGSSGTALDFLIYIALVYGVQVHYVLAGVIGFVVAVVWNFLWNRLYTFGGQSRNIWEQFHEYLLIALVGLLWHSLLLWCIVEIFSGDFLIAKVVATGVVIIWNFLGSKYITFASKELGISPFPALDTPLVSVVIPCFNEERRVGQTLQEIQAYIQEANWKMELLIVDDGSTDATAAVVHAAMEGSHVPYHVYSFPHNQGKGAAVQEGVKQAQGQFILVMDADHSTHIREIEQFWNVAEKEPLRILIGSRYLKKGSIQTKQSWVRQGISRIGNVCIRTLLLPSVRDSQCGFKWFPAVIAKPLFAQLQVRGFAYDVEILARAKRQNIVVKELPITWNNHKESRVRLVADPVRMLWDLVYIRCTLWK